MEKKKILIWTILEKIMKDEIQKLIQENYKPLIPEELSKNSLQLKLPTPFKALFTKEHSLKYAIMEALLALSPMGEYLIPTANEQTRYIDIYCNHNKNRFGIEVKKSLDKFNKEQMKNYFYSKALDFIYLVYPVVHETEDSHIQLYYKASGGYKDLNKYAFARASMDSYGTLGRTGKKLNINEEIRIKRGSYLEEIRAELRPKSFDFLKSGLNEGIGLIAVNPLGGVQILSEPAFILNETYKDNEVYEKIIEGNISKPEEKIKFAIWKYYREKKCLIAAEAPLEYSSRVTEKWFTKDGIETHIDESYKRVYEYLGSSLKEAFKENVGYEKRVRVGAYIIDFVVLDKAAIDNEGELIGIECKASSKDIDFEQLKSYYESYQLDRLYVAFGDQDSEKIKSFFQQKLDDSKNWINDVGLILVTTNEKIIIKKMGRKLKPINKKWFKVNKMRPKNPYNFEEIPSMSDC